MKRFCQVDRFLGHSFISDIIKPNSLVVDLGANKGEFSSYMADKFRARVLAVEPMPIFFNSIKEDAFIQKFNYGIAGKNEKRKFFVPSSICPNFYRGENKDPTIEVNCISLDKFFEENNIKHVDLLKVDIEGAEIELFESLKKETLQKIDQITVEFHEFLWPELKPQVKAIKKKLAEDFYCVSFSLTNNGDVLFIRKSLISPLDYIYLKYFKRYLMGLRRKFKK